MMKDVCGERQIPRNMIWMILVMRSWHGSSSRIVFAKKSLIWLIAPRAPSFIFLRNPAWSS
jgi:hypothetical protein